MIKPKELLRKPSLLFRRDRAEANSPPGNQYMDVVTENLLMLAAQNHVREIRRLQNPISLDQVEFRCFSQFGDDGIIQFLIHYLDIKEDSFIEFGVENYTESNTRFLVKQNNWKGLVIDGNPENIEYIKNDRVYWQQQLTAVAAFIDRDNINDLIHDGGFDGEIGLLSVDIDGNDYWVWEAINTVNPSVVVAEYNSVFGPTAPITIPYQEDFYRTSAHCSNLYYGASLAALCHLAKEKNYRFVGCNTAGNNAYFVRNDCCKDLKALTPEEGYVESRFRESRDIDGKMTLLSGIDRWNEIAGMPVVNVVTQQATEIKHSPFAP